MRYAMLKVKIQRDLIGLTAKGLPAKIILYVSILRWRCYSPIYILVLRGARLLLYFDL